MPPTLSSSDSLLLVIDVQTRLMPAIADAASLIAHTDRLIRAARMLDIAIVFTEQNPIKLGGTVPELAAASAPVMAKMTFDAGRTSGFEALVPRDRQIIVAGCEAHVCVLQTVLGLRAKGQQVFVVQDAIGSRQPASKLAALARMSQHGAELITTEMALFEWLGSAEHPHFRDAVALIR